MRLRFYIDPEMDQPHIYRHDVSEEEVEEVLARSGEDRRGRDGSRVALGRTSGGRFLPVVYVPDDTPGSAFVVTAFELTGKPLAADRQRSRRRPS